MAIDFHVTQGHSSHRLGIVILLILATANGLNADEASISFKVSDYSQTTSVEYGIKITGQISTPDESGVRSFPLQSTGEFLFEQKQVLSEAEGPFGLRAIRQFASASTTTRVGKDHQTSVELAPYFRTIHVYGASGGLQAISPRYQLPRKQLDLLQLPFDALSSQALLTSNSVKAGDKWNTAAWVTPLVTGLDAVVEQTTTCTLKSIHSDTANVTFEGTVSGAVLGSTSNIRFSGTLTVDLKTGVITSLTANQNEKRSPGPVSPGLDVDAAIEWRQKLSKNTTLAESRMPETASASNLLVLLQTPLKLRLQHSREWHLFHETPSVMMIRQLRDGSLISQCNISSSITVPPGEHTPDKEFLADVTDSVNERKGKIVEQETSREDAKWRVRRVRAVGDAAGKRIIWDYHLCTAASGQQFSIVFSYSESDKERFGQEAKKLLSTLRIARNRPALPYR